MAGIYLHIPFCEHKCMYCDFYSIEHLSGIESFVHALEREIMMYEDIGAAATVETIFFGGGTPSLLSPSQLERILSRLYGTFFIHHDAEITVEANPGTVDAQKLADYRSCGVNRLSLGVQSFHEEELRFLTRIHSAEQARDCVRTARRVGFSNVSVDLMFGLPGQTLERWQSNVYQALDLDLQHVSAYSLIVEAGTPLARMVAAKQVMPLPVDDDAEIYEWTMEALEAAGYEHYEVSNYAKHGFRSRHNSNYWNHTDYLGFGPSAHSFWTSTGVSRRWWNIANLKTYIEKTHHHIKPLAGSEVLADDQLLEEAILLGLRSDGIDLKHIQRKYSVDLAEHIGPLIHNLLDQGLAVLSRDVLRLTSRGFLVCDAITEEIFTRLSAQPHTAQTITRAGEQVSI